MVIPPLQTIQFQMETICTDWGIPFVNISGITNPEDIPENLNQSSPKVILSSIEDISREEVQTHLQHLQIAYVAIDECQVWVELFGLAAGRRRSGQ